MPEDELLARFLEILDADREEIPGRFLPHAESLGKRRDLGPRDVPCRRFLARVEMIASAQARPLVELLREGSAFAWGQTYGAGDFGEEFLRNYGWLEVFGSRGHFVHGEVAGGLLLLGPETLYPDHHHLAEEIYVPLTDASEWRMAGGPFRLRQAGEVIHHASNVPHAMRTGREPMLALYLWSGGPLDQKSEIGAAACADCSSQTPSHARNG